MEKEITNENVSTNKSISAQQAEEIKTSKRIAAKLSRKWKALAKKQKTRGKKISSSNRISSITLKKDRLGKLSVQVNMENGRQVSDSKEEKKVLFHEKRETERQNRAKKIKELLKKIKENGYSAVESEIPADLKEAVLKACEKAHISTTAKENKVAKKEKAAHKADTAPSHKPFTPSIAPVIAGDILASPLFDVPEFRNKYKIETVKPRKQRRQNSSSVTETVSLALPDGSKFSVKLNGDNINANITKLEAAKEVLLKVQNGEALKEDEQKYFNELKKHHITNLTELQENSSRMNNISDKSVPIAFQADLKQAKGIDAQRISEYNSNKEAGGKELVPLDISIGRSYEDLNNDKKLSKEDKNRKELLNFYQKMSGDEKLTEKAVKFSEDMMKKGISGKELWSKLKKEKLSKKEMEQYIEGRINGKIPAPPSRKRRNQNKARGTDKASKAASAEKPEAQRVIDKMKKVYDKNEVAKGQSLQAQIESKMTLPMRKALLQRKEHSR